MKNSLVSLVLCLLSFSAFSTNMIMPIRGVADGDTINSTLELPCPLCNVSVRILGIDTPESNYLAKCPAEQAKGIAAKEFVTKLAENQPTMMARSIKWDKYGGRIDAYVEINGINVGNEMIRLGHAKPYTGSGPKPDWCA